MTERLKTLVLGNLVFLNLSPDLSYAEDKIRLLYSAVVKMTGMAFIKYFDHFVITFVSHIQAGLSAYYFRPLLCC